MTDIDDFTDYGEQCGCGHPHRAHRPTACTGTHRQLDHERLPAPTDNADDATDDPFAWPSNWPPVDQAPTRERPCGCTRFGPADPEPPEEW